MSGPARCRCHGAAMPCLDCSPPQSPLKAEPTDWGETCRCGACECRKNCDAMLARVQRLSKGLADPAREPVPRWVLPPVLQRQVAAHGSAEGPGASSDRGPVQIVPPSPLSRSELRRAQGLSVEVLTGNPIARAHESTTGFDELLQRTAARATNTAGTTAGADGEWIVRETELGAVIAESMHPAAVEAADDSAVERAPVDGLEPASPQGWPNRQLRNPRPLQSIPAGHSLSHTAELVATASATSVEAKVTVRPTVTDLHATMANSEVQRRLVARG